MSNYSAFFYGTLMSPKVLYRVVFGSSSPAKEKRDQLKIVPAILHSYCRHKVYMCDYPGIILQEGKSVIGVYVTGLDFANIRSLDVFEGRQYEREKVKVRLLDETHNKEKGKVEGAEVEAETYVFQDKDDLVDEEWSYEEFVKDKLHRWADTSEEYYEVDNAVDLASHDPTGGRSINGEMDNRLSGKEGEEILESAV